jgi:hypothetical protein
VPAGLCTRLNRKDSVEATQTQTDKTAGRQAEFMDKFVKGFRYAQMLFVGAYSVSTFMRLGSIVARLLAVVWDSTKSWYRFKEVTNSTTSSQINPLNAELNPICHSLILLGYLTFMGL